MNGREEPKSVVRAERFELVDAAGHVRAALGTSKEGHIGLGIFDDDGNLRAALHLPPDGSARLSLGDGNGVERAMLGVEPDGSPVLHLGDETGKVRVLGHCDDGGSALTLFDAAGKPRAFLNTDTDDGTPALILLDEGGEVRTTVTLGPTGRPEILLYDKEGTIMWKAPPPEQ